jgi:hypothetical protein
MVVSFETRDYDSHDRNAELRLAEIDDDGLGNAGLA